jgi:sugar phosphate isomerase/epimerase
VRLTAAQALVRFLAAQYVERDGIERRFFGGCLGIFGHGNVGGVGEALYAYPELLPYYHARNEQGMVHVASGYARTRKGEGDVDLTGFFERLGDYEGWLVVEQDWVPGPADDPAPQIEAQERNRRWLAEHVDL